MTGLKSKTGRVKGLIKGAPTAVLVSIGIHLVLLFLATGLVVFHVVKNKEVAFVPPEKFDRPKMNLRKLRVKVKQDTKPKRSATRITTKTQTAMPDIQLPPMTGLGGGLGEDLGGFQVMADLSEMKSMGSPVSIGNDLVGTCYDMKRLKNGTENPLMPIKANDGNQHKFINLLHKFAGKDNNWDRKMLDKYYQSPKKLYATQFMVPPCASGLAPPQFGMSDQTVGSQWVAIYTGEIGLKDRGGRFRFWGRGDDHLFVRINGKLVLEGSHADRPKLNWHPEVSPEPERPRFLAAYARAGDWFTLEPGVPVTMDVLIGKARLGTFYVGLLVEEEGVEYPENKYGSPIFPMFKTMEAPPHTVDEIEFGTVEDRFDITGGPIFAIH